MSQTSARRSDETHPMIHRALGYRFTIRADPPLRDVFTTALAPLVDSHPADSHHAADAGRHDADIEVTFDGARWSISDGEANLTAHTAGHALARTLEHINQRAAACAVTAAPLHAAAVRHPRGSIVALAGSSGSGKSTLCAAAVRADWGFISEELTAVDSQTFEVQPYRRPIGLRAGGAQAIGIAIPVSDDGVFDEVYPWPVAQGQWAAGGPLDAVALVARRSGASTLEIVEPPSALAELIEHVVVPHDDAVVAAFRSLESLVRAIPVARLGFDTPDDGLQLLHDLVRRLPSGAATTPTNATLEQR